MTMGHSNRIGANPADPTIQAPGPNDAATDHYRHDVSGFNNRVVAEFRANGGNVGGPFVTTPLLLITTIGARSGLPRTTPLSYTEDGGRIVVLASNAGGPNNPDWYHNLRANPVATVELGTEQFQVQASVVEGEERQRLYGQHVAIMPGYAEYQEQAPRQIPVLALERID